VEGALFDFCAARIRCVLLARVADGFSCLQAGDYSSIPAPVLNYSISTTVKEVEVERDPEDFRKWLFGKRLRELRGWRTLDDVAAMSDGRVTPGALSFIERGEREAKLLTLEALADGYGVTITIRPGLGFKITKARRR
jgi:hypothetical protein